MRDNIFSIIFNNREKVFQRFDNPLKAFLYYKNRREDLLTGEINIVHISEFEKSLSKQKISERSSSPTVIHLFYEYGFLYIDEFKIDDDVLLAIELNYSETSDYYPTDVKELIDLKRVFSPTLSKYKESFDKGYQHLLKGNCYQFNLTYPFEFCFDKRVEQSTFIDKFLGNIDNLGAYSHLTSIESISKLYLSNSPECLFQVGRLKEELHLWTMPIKGTLKIDKEKSILKQWQKLSRCKKNEPELHMITDLLRNDLSKIGQYYSKVIKEKMPLVVPGILHQYSLMAVELEEDVLLGQIIKAMYPGGSITGAPKIRVMGILKEIEKRDRGFYTGSTIILHNDIIAGSINIRSSEVDFKTNMLSYGAGGGVTLQSSAEEEFKEMELKVDSFLKLFS